MISIIEVNNCYFICYSYVDIFYRYIYLLGRVFYWKSYARDYRKLLVAYFSG